MCNTEKFVLEIALQQKLRERTEQEFHCSFLTSRSADISFLEQSLLRSLEGSPIRDPAKIQREWWGS